jgi:hypothetical protein
VAFGILGLALLVLAMFAETLIAPGSHVLGAHNTDLRQG